MKFKFDEDKRTMVITTKNILKGIKDIIIVYHDAEDGIWQFLDGEEIDEKESAIISLLEMYNIDNSIGELFDLPLGFMAYREDKKSPWIIRN